MARLVTKFGYMKSGTKKKSGGYAKYIATREGVEKLDDSVKKIPATDRQKQLVQKLLQDFPDSKDTHEYQDSLVASLDEILSTLELIKAFSVIMPLISVSSI